MDVNERIRALMEERGWTPYRLAKESGLSEGTVGNIFRRNTVPLTATLQAICGGLKITLCQFFAGGEMIELTPELRELFDAETVGCAFRRATNEALGQVRQMLIWNKNSFTMGHQDYQWKHEACIYGWTDGGSHYFIDDRTHASVIEDKRIDINKLKKEEMRELLRELFSDKISTTVIDENKPARNGDHPTMKPLKLLARLIKNSSRQGDIVLDTFGGSGSTLITCEQLGRSCYTMELDPKYADVIVKRWLKFTGTDRTELVRDGRKWIVEANVFWLLKLPFPQKKSGLSLLLGRSVSKAD